MPIPSILDMPFKLDMEFESMFALSILVLPSRLGQMLKLEESEGKW